jgi:pantoate--beta-alanine ligase
MKLKQLSTVPEIRAALELARLNRETISCVPTMGALHEGHLALIEAAKRCGSVVVVTIFVNPTQFGPNEDFAKYPRTLSRDLELCEHAGVTIVFSPSVEEMYPSKADSYVDVLTLSNTLCGAKRPGHFRGVCTVVLKLLNIIQPHHVLFGAKDAQQARILRQMILDLNIPVQMHIEPTVREADGLAMSSRNRYLTSTARLEAPKLYSALLNVRASYLSGHIDVAVLESMLRSELQAIPGARIDYANIVDDVTLQPIIKLDRPALVAIAVFFDSTRLIDNITLQK